MSGSPLAATGSKVGLLDPFFSLVGLLIVPGSSVSLHNVRHRLGRSISQHERQDLIPDELVVSRGVALEEHIHLLQGNAPMRRTGY